MPLSLTFSLLGITRSVECVCMWERGGGDVVSWETVAVLLTVSKSFNVVLQSDVDEPVFFKFGIMIATTKLYWLGASFSNLDSKSKV